MEDRRRSSVKAIDHGNDGVIRVDDDVVRRLSVARPNILEEQNAAVVATDAEKNLSVRQSIKLYKKGIFFSLIFGLAVVMEGYDLAAIGSFLGYTQFKRSFGTEFDNEGLPLISPAWQAGIQNGLQAGSIIGLWLNGYVSEWIGYKKTMYAALILTACFNCLHFFAINIEMIAAGSTLLGLPYGAFQTLSVTYASDVMPSTLRPYLTTYINLCWVFGQLIAAGVVRGCSGIDSEWGWRIPVAIQWFWIPLIIVGTLFAPESPWWLVRKGRHDAARRAMLQLVSPTPEIPFDVDGAVSMINHTNELEHAMDSGLGYTHCFRGTNLRRTIIACVVWLTQALCGAALMGYAVQIYQEAGLSEENALNLNIGQYVLGGAGTLASWFLMKRIGRRDLYVWGIFILFILLMIIGGLGVISRENTAAAWGLGSLLMVYTLFYDLTVGPVCYAIVAEIPSTRLKIKTVALARNVYNLGGIFNNIVLPRMLSPTAWNWAGMTGFFYAGPTLLLFIFMFFMLPECKDRTYAELDVLFENKVSARKFASTDVDSFSGQTAQIARWDSASGSGSESGGEKGLAGGYKETA